MEGFVKLIGIVIVAIGAIYFAKPALMKKMAEFFTKEKWIYVGGIVSFIVGIIFLRAASQCAISWFVVLFGLVSLIKGIAIFIMGQQKIKSLLHAITKKPPKTLRVLAMVEIAIGVMLIYAV